MNIIIKDDINSNNYLSLFCEDVYIHDHNIELSIKGSYKLMGSISYLKDDFYKNLYVYIQDNIFKLFSSMVESYTYEDLGNDNMLLNINIIFENMEVKKSLTFIRKNKMDKILSKI